MTVDTRSLALALTACVGIAACASSSAPRASLQRPADEQGYLSRDQLPDSAFLLPPPPAEDSPAFANDIAIQRAAFALRGTPRWTLATSDADLSFPHAAGVYACALGLPIDAQRTPRLYALLHRTFLDAARAGGAAKNRYQRERPFARNAQPTCAPHDEAELRTSGSYPSGHAAIGWAWALVLAELDPRHADATLLRGRQYAESRLVCNAHWQSDIIAGRQVGAATVAREHADPAFRQDLRSAGAEIAQAQARGLAPAQDCAAQSAALVTPIPGVL